jgi:3-hydroxyisobutyrate dehydrogenase-like beta-hydroxyacid dehydrogenase
MRVAVIGIGRMGRALVSRLLVGGQEVVVWNRTPGKANQLVSKGAWEARKIEEAARCDVVVLALADDAAVLSTLDKLVGSAGFVVNTSTVSPETTDRLAAALGPRFVASPIMGSPEMVETGQARYLVGGAPDTVSSLASLWEILGEIVPCGDRPALATTTKLMSNYLLMTGIATLAEAIAIGEAGGLDLEFVRLFLGGVPTVAPALRNRLDDLINGSHDGWFTTKLGAKDVRLAGDLAESAGAKVPIARLVEQRYDEAAARGWADADLGAVIEVVRPA